ncbi:helix-hairpin-helix domain-containing protein [Rubrivirga sp. IMCC45206]|uniref:helix-hairpin-helix domain-containing protein n=1 Tax=Rubrivirga sp. IMCC45206 TaxID=3391614 RepID=UPI00398F9BC4
MVVRPESAPVPAPKSATGDASGLTAEVTTEDLTKIYGLGDTFAEKLTAAGVDSFEALANADLDTLREIISADGTDDQGVNEETWSKQARLLADGDFEAYDDYVEGLREADGNVVEIDEPDADDEAPAPAVDAADAATSEDGDAPADEPAA